jgi:hypothetical protein
MLETKLVKTGLVAAAMVSAMMASSVANASIDAFSTDFNSATDLTPWEFFGDNGGLAGGYGGAAPNGPQISALADDGGGNQFMNVYANYANGLVHNNPPAQENISVYVNQAFGAADTASGATWQFDFDYAENPPNPVTGATTTGAFIRVFDVFFNLLDQQMFDTNASATAAFQSASLSQTLDSAWTNGNIQFGFTNKTGDYQGSGRFYDNVNWDVAAADVPVPATIWLVGAALMGLVGASRRKS